MLRSIRVSRVLVNRKRLPSGEKVIVPILAPAGTATLRSAPPLIVRTVMPVPDGARCGPLVRGLMRRPAMRSMGCETSSIPGIPRRETTTSVSRLGPTVTVGIGSASRMSTISFGGVRYPDDAADCASNPAVVPMPSVRAIATIRVRIAISSLRAESSVEFYTADSLGT